MFLKYEQSFCAACTPQEAEERIMTAARRNDLKPKPMKSGHPGTLRFHAQTGELLYRDTTLPAVEVRIRQETETHVSVLCAPKKSTMWTGVVVTVWALWLEAMLIWSACTDQLAGWGFLCLPIGFLMVMWLFEYIGLHIHGRRIAALLQKAVQGSEAP